jgi:hypothetical protein
VKCRLFTIFAALSLLLCVAVAGMWVPELLEAGRHRAPLAIHGPAPGR